MQNVVSTVVAISLAALPTVALAQPSETPPEPTPVVVAAPEPERNWGIGVHLGGMGLHPEEMPDEEVGLGGGGLQIRWRFARRWELDLDLSHFAGELSKDGPVRHVGSATLGVMFHFNPGSRWLWSAMLGVGGAHDEIRADNMAGEEVTVAEFKQGMFRIGAGLERRFDRVGLGAQIFAVGMERNDDELDGPAYVGMDGPVPQKSSGGLAQLSFNYYF